MMGSRVQFNQNFSANTNSQFGGGNIGLDMSYRQASPVKNSQIANSRPLEEEVVSFGDSQNRVNYLRRLYFAVLLQFIFASFLTYKTESSLSFRTWVLENSGLTFIVAMIVTIALSLTAFLQKAILSRLIINYVAYFAYTLAFAFLLSYFNARNTPNIHIILHILTYLFIGLFLHALLCLGPITFQNAALFVIGSVIFIILKLEIFSDISFMTLHVFGILTILLGFYIIWENETVISGAKTEWSREDPIIGSISFILNLFTLFLRLANLISRIAIVSYSRP